MEAFNMETTDKVRDWWDDSWHEYYVTRYFVPYVRYFTPVGDDCILMYLTVVMRGY